jgi:hypothetical protein
MPKYRFPITRETTVTAIVEVSADTAPEAMAMACSPSFHADPANGVVWTVDEGNPVRDVYVPDESECEIVEE